MPLYQAQPSLRLCHAALDLYADYRFSFYKSLIVAVALEARCEWLYSEDLQDGQNIDGLAIVNPFARRSPGLRKGESRRKTDRCSELQILSPSWPSSAPPQRHANTPSLEAGALRRRFVPGPRLVYFPVRGQAQMGA
jgi:hypothetical protein